MDNQSLLLLILASFLVFTFSYIWLIKELENLILQSERIDLIEDGSEELKKNFIAELPDYTYGEMFHLANNTQTPFFRKKAVKSLKANPTHQIISHELNHYGLSLTQYHTLYDKGSLEINGKFIALLRKTPGDFSRLLYAEIESVEKAQSLIYEESRLNA